MVQELIIKGTELKYKVNLTASGFDMDSCDFYFTIYGGGKSKTVSKSELVYDGEHWYLCFGTTDLNLGMLTVDSTAVIPDDDFPDGFRTEVKCTTLGVLING